MVICTVTIEVNISSAPVFYVCKQLALSFNTGRLNVGATDLDLSV